MGNMAGKAGNNIFPRSNRVACGSRDGYPADRCSNIVGSIISIFTGVGDNDIRGVADPDAVAAIIYFMHVGMARGAEARNC